MNMHLKNILPDGRIVEFLFLGIEKTVSSSDYFIRAGEIPFKIAYVYSGIWRYVYHSDKGDEYIKAILPENTIISSYSE